MGKKTKVGKSRRDKFYQLAKETGYRSRASFKLLQLNRKYEFLQKSRVCLDLCAAPGGWLQVAAQQMPVSSVIIGVDLVGIKPIPNVVTFQEDITTEKCRQTLKKELQTWKADVVLHDGAPNVGSNWLHDAFQQAQLTLQALKLASEFLRKGGWFVTKVFRSKDYNSLLWVFNQLFKKVFATKPLASRTESAEIFVVCQHYLAPDKLDPKFLNPQHVFKDLSSDTTTSSLNLIHPEKTSKKAEGYQDNANVLFTKITATDFLAADNHIELLANGNQILIDDDNILNNPLTTEDIKESCKDLKVLGKREIRQLIKWRHKLKEMLEKASTTTQPDDSHATKNDDDDEEVDDANLDEEIKQIADDRRKDLKKKRKKVMREKRKLRDRMNLNMVIPGDRIDANDDIDLFNLNKIRTKQGLDEMESAEPVAESDTQSVEDDVAANKRISVPYEQRSTALTCSDNYQDMDTDSDDDDDDSQLPRADDDDDDDDDDMHVDDVEAMKEKLGEVKDKNPLIIDLDSQSDTVRRQTDMWFSKDIFNDVNVDDDDSSAESDVPSTERTRTISSAVPSGKDRDVDSDSDYDINRLATKKEQKPSKKKKQMNNPAKDGFEIVKPDQSTKGVSFVKLSPVELAIGEELIKSSKRRREILDMSYHRYTYGDENLPSWFKSDEVKHCRKQLPVTKDQVAYYKDRLKSIDSRPIKKIAEAKARKKRKMTKRLEKARKKADLVSENLDVSDKEKWKQIKDIYKKAGLLKKSKKQITYVVAKKGVGRRVSRPAGVKGHFKVVDPRMKKDNRKQKTTNKNKTKKKHNKRSTSRTK